MRVIESGDRDMRVVRPLGKKEFQTWCCCFRLSREGGLKRGDKSNLWGKSGSLDNSTWLESTFD